MELHSLKKNSGFNKPAKTIGRGNGSGKGNYSTKGLKGQTSRSGGGMPSWFEGGQTPLYQRLPKKKGFKRHFKFATKVVSISLNTLEGSTAIKAGTTIDKTVLVDAGLLKSIVNPVKIIGNNLSKKLSFDGIEQFSAGAKETIEKNGGSISGSAE